MILPTVASEDRPANMPVNAKPLLDAQRVVLIDEQTADTALIRRSLQDDRLREYSGTFDVLVVATVQEAAEHLETDQFSAILLDISDDASLTALTLLRNLELTIPVIVLTANGCENLAIAALRAGADDCLEKAGISGETLPRALRSAIERRQRMLFEVQLKAARADVQAAETIQHRLLPHAPPRLPCVDLAGICIPAETIGGDLFDYLHYDDSHCLGVVADVSGHGLPAGILMTELHGLLHGLVDQNLDLAHIAAAANRRVFDASQCHQFITMLLYQLDLRKRTFAYVSAGHPGWLIRSSGESLELLGRQLPLGVNGSPQYRYTLDRVNLQSGDILVLPTDGVFEPRDEEGEMFGIERMLDAVRRHSHRSAEEIVSRVVSAVCTFSSSDQLADDCTLVIIKVE